MIIKLFDNQNLCKKVLFYCANHLLKDASNLLVIEPIDILSINRFDDVKDSFKDMGPLFTLGNGVHYIPYSEGYNCDNYTSNRPLDPFHWSTAAMKIDINNIFDNKEVLKTNTMFTHEVKVVRQVKIEIPTKEMFKLLISDAKKYISDFKKNYIYSLGKLKKYVYDSRDTYWNESSACNYRSFDSVFLKKGEKDAIVKYVDEFMQESTRQDYIKFNIPYKSNILLYGKPGTGKTTTILAVASHLKTNIGIIPISKHLDDNSLIQALTSIRRNNCKILVIEDIDCIFHDRKKNDTFQNSLTMSGLLNCMDGLFRAEGIIVFMTTNNIEVLDEAMTRSARIDYMLEYTWVDEHQVRECFQYYFPSQMEDFDGFYSRICHKNITIADLQDFFFKYRKSEKIIQHIQDFKKGGINNSNKNKGEDVGAMYM